MSIDNNIAPRPESDQPDSENLPETLIVPPPHYRERLQAAQRARASEVRPSTEIPVPSQRLADKPDDTDDAEPLSRRS
jgi:hypothetical protein